MSTCSSKAKNLAPALSMWSKATAVTSAATGHAHGTKTSAQPAQAHMRAVHPPSSSPPHSSSPVFPQTSAKELHEITQKKTEEQKKGRNVVFKVTHSFSSFLLQEMLTLYLDIKDHARRLKEAEQDASNPDNLSGHNNTLSVEVDQSDNDNDEACYNATFGSPHFEDNVVNEEEQMSVDGDIKDEDNMDVDGLMDTHGPDNEIHVESSPEPVMPTKKSTKQASIEKAHRRMLLTAMSPSRSRASSLAPSSTATHCYKITHGNFTPRTYRYDEATKKGAHHATTTENAFPADKQTFFLDVAQCIAAAESSSGPEFSHALTRLLVNPDMLKDFTTYIDTVMATSRFNLPGRLVPNEVKPVVTWLLHDSHYKYGDVDAENRTFDAGQPFGSEGLAHILRLEVFATKGNANVEVFKDIVAARQITGPTIALMFTAIEHALMQYSEGSYRFSEFSDAARPRMQSNKSHVLDVQADDMSNVDLAALEANAVSAKAREVSGAGHATTAPIASTSTAPVASASTAGLST
ncbi:hypothetical protein BT96DRAFT_941242 [Gymnopus androsaceus JB14]|uniref:DUF6532 domain-containing protein n=1 Tax=Gymnopus androsaceus JB14 TaxID=1447944 RepID=A0A6A4HGF5_9AGAR|nr:hypothetical protein BT96DRAFT_941242 [Gymnopus androsaceus JB14]